ncbi:MAG: hypothetical protein IKV96_02420 [Firmicutes bacterium]|nr:hypothetical protein [Bacillota bacterium]
MHHFDERLQQLSQEMARKKKLESMLHDLMMQKYEVESKVAKLKAEKDKEQADVDRIEGGTLYAFFCGVFGNKEEKLTKEREEAHAAAVKYDAAVKELEAIVEDMNAYQAEISQYINCEPEYAMLLTKKAYDVKMENGPIAGQIIQLEERLAYLENQKREVSEAMAAGSNARTTAEMILSKLSTAKGWGTWDIFGGGLLTDVMKHSTMDDAQILVQTLQKELRRFKTELADISIGTSMQVNVTGMLRFADFFFDGLFMDWAVLDRINRSYNQVLETTKQIEKIMGTLRTMDGNLDKEMAALKGQVDNLILRA